MATIRFRFLTLVLCILLSTHAYCEWFKGHGQAVIVDGEVEQARNIAVQDALLSLMYEGGASVDAIRIVNQGVLEKNLLTIRTRGEVHDMRLIKESIKGNIIYVTVSADISNNKCSPDNYAKTMFIGPLDLQKREHAQLGGIYRVPEEVTRRLFYRFKEASRYVDVRHLRTRQIAFDDRFDNDIERQMLSVAHEISNQYDVQYVLFGKISDMSTYDETISKPLMFDKTIKQRNYQIRLYVVDGIKGYTVFRKNYSDKAEWPFDVTMKFDVTGNIFWSSDYGKLIDTFIDNSVADIQKALTCKPSIATVKNIYDNKVMINLGQVNGINPGDTFRLIREQFISEQPHNNMQGVFNPSDVEFVVTQVQANRAILETQNDTGLENIQIRDRLIASEPEALNKTVYKYK